MAISDWDPVANNNSAIDGINIAEGCAPAGWNNAVRSLMAWVRQFWGVAYRKNETVFIQATGGAAPAGMAENDLLIEYIP